MRRSENERQMFFFANKTKINLHLVCGSILQEINNEYGFSNDWPFQATPNTTH